MQDKIYHFLNTKMSRDEFLKHLMWMALGVVGISSLLKYLAGNNYVEKAINPTNGYGFHNYGGIKKKGKIS